MPRRVDHVERRAQITDAAREVIARDGLEATTFHAVASEAEVSIRLVQYYFGNKESLLAATHRAVIETAAARFNGGRPAPSAVPPRDVLSSLVTALLPLDATRRSDAIVLAAFHAAALTRDSPGHDALLAAPDALVRVIADQLGRARSAAPSGHSDELSTTDAHLVLACITGLTESVLAGHLAPERAVAVAERLLDHLL